ncbi:MAG: hypothetical protein CM15mP102_09690 [Flavobacteriales bacterium]|nr:MAG: hypothetical protein CM15mP102_09690 [Flavobacteriales bacterium]
MSVLVIHPVMYRLVKPLMELRMAETHYIYVTYPDLISALDFGSAANQDESKAIVDWLELLEMKNILEITRVMLKSWE